MRGALQGHLPSQKTPPNSMKRSSLLKSQVGIGAKPEVRKWRRNRGTMLIAAGVEHREDKSVRRDDNPEAPVSRMKPAATSKYLPKKEDEKRDLR